MDFGDYGLLILIAFLTFAILYLSTSNNTAELSTERMGEMICSEKGDYEFKEFDISTNTVICKEKNVSKYDGGYIKIER